MGKSGNKQGTAYNQIPHRKTPKGGFTDGRRMQHVRKRIHCSVREYPERSPDELDNTDKEIEAAIREGRQIRLDHAFPNAAAHPRRTFPGSARFELNPGANLIEFASDDKSASGECDDLDYINEFRLVVVHRLSLKGAPLSQIGAVLGVSAKQAQRLFDKLTERLSSEAKHVDIMALIGETLAFYHSVRTECMKIAANHSEVSVRLKAMDTALAAEADKHRFLQACGFYANARYVPQSAQ